MQIMKFIKNWTLPISMLAGVVGYFIVVNIPALKPAMPYIDSTIKEVVQPLLIFSMLFLTFCKVKPQELHPRKWHLWLLLVQAGAFSLLSLILILLPHSGLRVVLEGAMICLICPTATAAAVITGKLGGSSASVVTYTILINLVAATLIPSLVPFVHPNPDMSVINSFAMIIGKVFPMLILPFVAAILVRYLLPGVHSRLVKFKDLSFYMWAVALALAIAITVDSMVKTTVSVWAQVGLAVVSLICCLLQFYIGRKTGRRYGDPITAGQAMGQKNTVLAIWLGYTFFTPVTSLAGGFYSIWHNVINSYQLYEERKKEAMLEKLKEEKDTRQAGK